MKKLLAALALFVGLNANAGVISVSVSNANVAVGDTVEVSIWAQDFEPLNYLYFELEYNVDLFAFVPASLTGVLSDSSDFLYTVDEYFYGLAASWDNDNNISEGNFLAAKFNLTAISQGYTDFSLVNVFAFVDAEAGQGASASVPAPATYGLFTLALFALVGLRRKA